MLHVAIVIAIFHPSLLNLRCPTDLKPANILINSQGQSKISDFGLARQHQNTTVMTIATGAGTLPYMAPELLVGRGGGLHEHITNRCDIYR
jgi:serine/threonine protein kinase